MTRFALLISSLALVCACSKKQDDSAAKNKTPAKAPTAAQAKDPAKAAKPPTAKTPDVVMTPLQVWDARAKAAKDNDGAALKRLYADDAVAIPVGSPMKMQGPEQIAATFTMFAKGFPDMKADSYVVLDKGPVVAGFSRIRGTNEGAMMGMPATGKPTSYIGLQILDIDPATGKIKRETLYADNLDFMAQMGLWDGPHRPYDTSEAPEERRASSTGSETETKNLEVVDAAIAAYNQRDATALSALYAADAVLANQAEPADYRGADIEGSYKRVFAAFPDIEKSEHKAWAAGDFVVSQYHMKATHKGPHERFSMKEGTGKPIELDGADVYRIADGKIVEHWVFFDAMFIAITVGAMKMPGMG